MDSSLSARLKADHGLTGLKDIFWNLTTAHLYEQIIFRREGFVCHRGPIVTRTGKHTGRAVKDRYIVKDDLTENTVWWGAVNKPFKEEDFDKLLDRFKYHFKNRDAFVQDCFCGADTNNRLGIRVITERAWHSLFARNMFIRPKGHDFSDHQPELTVLHAPRLLCDPDAAGTRSETAIVINLKKRIVLIGGTEYAGEIKKSVFSVMNYLLPAKGIFPMHCSANIGKRADVALFFGLSGTGKTTLSADPRRELIGDDEHGWGDSGVFNFEGGCYAKVIRLSRTAEPDIFQTTRRFGTILENVGFDQATRQLDLEDDNITENTRASYPISAIPNANLKGTGGQPKHLIMLTCDSFGIMPPVAKLSPEQAMFYFISGYTAKVAGTEQGIGNEPVAAFSPCFGAPFMPRHPSVYAELMRDLIAKNNVQCWLVNTGWSGGAFGVGERMPIQYTRAIVHAILDESLQKVEMVKNATFGFSVPKSCPGVPATILDPKNTWKDPKAFEAKAKDLAQKFHDHFSSYRDHCSDDVLAAAPQL